MLNDANHSKLHDGQKWKDAIIHAVFETFRELIGRDRFHFVDSLRWRRRIETGATAILPLCIGSHWVLAVVHEDWELVDI